MPVRRATHRVLGKQKYYWNLENVDSNNPSMRNMARSRVAAVRRGETFSSVYPDDDEWEYYNNHPTADGTPPEENMSFNEPTNLGRINSNLFGGPTGRKNKFPMMEVPERRMPPSVVNTGPTRRYNINNIRKKVFAPMKLSSRKRKTRKSRR